MTANEVRSGLQLHPFDVRVGQAQESWVARWYDDGREVGVATFEESDDGIEWTSFLVSEEWRGRGIYTKALDWSMQLGVQVTARKNLQPDSWAGFKVVDDAGNMKLDKRIAKGRVNRARQ